MSVDATLGVHHLRGERRAEVLVGGVGSVLPASGKIAPTRKGTGPAAATRRARRSQHREDQSPDQPEVAVTLGAEALQHRPILPAECAPRAGPEAQWWSDR